LGEIKQTPSQVTKGIKQDHKKAEKRIKSNIKERRVTQSSLLKPQVFLLGPLALSHALFLSFLRQKTFINQCDYNQPSAV
jgi:hypothetical protein